MKYWQIIRDKRVVCTTYLRYPPEIEKIMKEAGYRIKECSTAEVK